jgi:hypothetical protein
MYVEVTMRDVRQSFCRMVESREPELTTKESFHASEETRAAWR